jgi:ribulose-5-phosphate 4-epimerase/fuculose-1-phosphate aldolase
MSNTLSASLVAPATSSRDVVPVPVPAPVPELSLFARVAQAEINAAGRHLHETGSLSLGLSFNAAIRILGEDRFVLGKFSPRHASQPGAAIVVDFDGHQHEGPLDKGLREIIGVYAAIFRARPAVNAALHTHSPHITAFAVAHRPLPIIYGPLLRHTQSTIPVADWAPRYAPEPVVAAIEAHPDAPAVLLANRGLLAWGEKGLEKLAAFVAALEESAAIAIRSEILGGAREFPPGAFAATQKSLSVTQPK